MKRWVEAVSFYSALLSSRDMQLFLFYAVVRKYTVSKLSLENQSVVSKFECWPAALSPTLHCLYWVECVRQLVLLNVL